MKTKTSSINYLLINILVLFGGINARCQAIENPCRKYKDFINTTSVNASNLLSYDKPDDIKLLKVEKEETKSKVLDIAHCDIDKFISKVRTKKLKEQLRGNFRILRQEFYNTNDGIKIIMTKAIMGTDTKIYVNNISLIEGDINHSFTDFGEHDFDIKPHGAGKFENGYKFYGEESENEGSLYYGKFSLVFKDKERILTYQHHKQF